MPISILSNVINPSVVAWWTTWWAPALLAPFIGSLLGVLITRLPVGEPVFLARSQCPACGRRLTAIDLVPFLSWIALRGRCRTCRAPLGPFYPAIEAAAVLVALWAGVTVPPAVLWISCGLGWTLLTLAVIDSQTLLLPDALTLPLLPVGLAAAYALSVLPLTDHLIGAAIGGLVPAGLRLLYGQLRGREGLGLGDVKLLAASGAWVGWQGLVGVLLIGSISALATILAIAACQRRLDRQRLIPFGPFLCLGLWIVWLYGPLAFG